MNDLEKQNRHGEEGTHYVCNDRLELWGMKADCCGCVGHVCKVE